MVTDIPRCPKCGEIGQKVSGIYSDGISKKKEEYRDTEGYKRERDAEHQTLLSKKLEPPPKPRHWNSPTCEDYLVAGFGCLLLVGSFVFGGHAFLTQLRELPLAVFMFVVTIVYIHFANRRIYKKKDLYKQEYPRWEQAIQRWENLYYCKVHDGVFFPGQNRFAPKEQIIKFLYWGL